MVLNKQREVSSLKVIVFILKTIHIFRDCVYIWSGEQFGGYEAQKEFSPRFPGTDSISLCYLQMKCHTTVLCQINLFHVIHYVFWLSPGNLYFSSTIKMLFLFSFLSIKIAIWENEELRVKMSIFPKKRNIKVLPYTLKLIHS